MSNEVYRYKVVTMRSEDGNRISYKPHGPEVVMATDFDSLEAECERLRVENADLIEARDSRVSERLAALDRLGEERNALSAELAALKAASGEEVEPVAKLQWTEIVGLVNEVLGCEAHKFPCERGSIGHEMAGINFNSLARIIDRVQHRHAAQHQRITAALRGEVERMRMQLAACGVVALCNTPESAAKARDMHPDYMSASCQEVMRAVDSEMALRAELAALRGRQEAVARVGLVPGTDFKSVDFFPDLQSLPVGMQLYTAPPAAQDASWQWVPVSERLPQAQTDGRMVLAFVCGVTNTKATATVRELVQFAKEDGEQCAVTHWMPLPDAPAHRQAQQREGGSDA